MKRTEISEFGEFGLITHLTEKIALKNSSSVKGVGDDAAVLQFDDVRTLVTTDLLLEGIHFDLTYVPLKHLGYKAVVVNVSDICAMNATAKQITMSIGVSKRFSVEDLEQLYDGVKLACEKYNVDLIGGDTTASLTGLTISITCIGEARNESIVFRNGAKDNDLICVTGDLGSAYMGLQLLEREKIVFRANSEAKPDFDGMDYILQRQLRPEARADVISLLAFNDILPTSMIDISDGLSSELMHICTQSNVGCRIFEDKLPIHYQAAVMAEELNMNIVTAALNGGEDYELLFTASLNDYDKLITLEGIAIIGHITNSSYGLNLVGREGEEIKLVAQGWNPLL